MVLTLIVALVGSAAPPKLAAPGFTCVNLDTQACEFFPDHFAQQLVLRGFSVTTRSEISAMLGLERQRQMLGCGDESGCMAELAGGLGVDGLITGSLARFEGEFAINIKIIGSTTGKVLAAWAGRLRGDAAVLDWLSTTADAFAMHNGLVAKAAAPTLRSRAWIPAVLGGALGIACGALFIATKSLEARLLSGDLTVLDGNLTVTAVRSGGETLQLSSAIIGAAGLVSLAVAAVFLAFGSPENAPPPVALWLTPGGAFATVGGLF